MNNARIKKKIGFENIYRLKKKWVIYLEYYLRYLPKNNVNKLKAVLLIFSPEGQIYQKYILSPVYVYNKTH